MVVAPKNHFHSHGFKCANLLGDTNDGFVICIFLHLNKLILWGAVIDLEGKEWWEEHTSLGNASTVCPGTVYDFPQHQLLHPVCQEVNNSLAGRGGHSELGEFSVEDFWSDSVECQAEIHKQDLYLDIR